MFVDSFAQRTQIYIYIYTFPRCSSGSCKFSIVILGCCNIPALLSSCFLSFLIHWRVDRSIHSLCQQVSVLVQALSTLNLILGLAIAAPWLNTLCMEPLRWSISKGHQLLPMDMVTETTVNCLSVQWILIIKPITTEVQSIWITTAT